MHEYSCRTVLLRTFLTVAVLACAVPAYAQAARVAGTVTDEKGAPIKGATVTAENAQVSPGRFRVETDEKGRFSIVGMRPGIWTFTANARGFAPSQGSARVQSLASNPPVEFKLVRGAASYVGPMADVDAKDLQNDLKAADALYNSGEYDRAIAAYRAVLARVPSLTLINLQIGNAFRQKKDYDRAIAAYQEVLAAAPANEKARLYLGMTYLEKGDTAAAESALQAVASTSAATREVFYNLGEIAFSKRQEDEAAKWYEKAAAADPRWVKPLFKLALVAINRGDKAGAAAQLEKVVAVEPGSPEAARARTLLSELTQKQ